MKKNIVYLVLAFLVLSLNVNAQKDFHFIANENVSIKIPQGWHAIKLGKKMSDFSIYAKDSNSCKFVEIKCVRSVIEPKVRVNDIASERSHKTNFDYMQIDKVTSSKFNKYSGQLLLYSNTYLNDTYKGGVYGFISEGYTYTVEYYSEDTPKDRALIDKIINTISIESPDKQENIIEQEKSYVPENWNKVEEQQAETTIDSAQSTEVKKAQKDVEKQKAKIEKQKQKQLKQQAKAEKKRLQQEQKVKDKQEELQQEQKKLEKQKAKAEKDKAKQEKKMLKAQKKQEEALKKQKKAEEKAAKEKEKLEKEQKNKK
jgi:hypothetical protein